MNKNKLKIKKRRYREGDFRQRQRQDRQGFKGNARDRKNSGGERQHPH